MPDAPSAPLRLLVIEDEAPIRRFLRIAEEDLKLRGGGDVLGTRQSGLPEFRLAVGQEDGRLLACAHDDARLALERDPQLRSPRGEALRSLKRAGERIREGSNILAFPEGTRSPDGRILPFKTGSFVLALEAGVPVVPVAIEGSRLSLPPNSFLPRHHPIRVKVGRPIPTAGRDGHEREALMHEVREAILQLHRDIGGAGGEPQEVRAPRRAAKSRAAPQAD